MVLSGARARVLSLAMTAAALTATAPACKSGVIPGREFEDPLDLQGQLLGALPEGAHPLASVIWIDPLERRPDLVMPARWIDSSLAEVRGGVEVDAAKNPIRTFTLHLFRPPPAEALAEIPSPGGDVALMAFGELVIVDDADGDGVVQIDGHGTLAAGGRGGDGALDGAHNDRYIAGSGEMLIYVERPFPPAAAVGFHLVQGSKTGYQLMKYVCNGRVLSEVVEAKTANLEPQTSAELVRRRTCMNTHSP